MTFRENDALLSNAAMGIGSSREQAVSALYAAGVRALLAPSFGRIFFRNCWNLGIPAIAIETAGMVEGEQAYLDLEAGLLITKSHQHRYAPPPLFMRTMVTHGGLLSIINRQGARQ